jgi:hypothetical protein
MRHRTNAAPYQCGTARGRYVIGGDSVTRSKTSRRLEMLFGRLDMLSAIARTFHNVLLTAIGLLTIAVIVTAL